MTYVEGLRVIEEYFSKPLTVLGWVTPAESAEIFGNISELFHGNTALLDEISEKLGAWNVDSTLGDTFVKNIGALTPHLTYVENFTQSSETLNRLLSQDKASNLSVFLQVGPYLTLPHHLLSSFFFLQGFLFYFLFWLLATLITKFYFWDSSLSITDIVWFFFRIVLLVDNGPDLTSPLVRYMPDVNGHSIGDMLILPVQRIPRYRMFLEDLIKKTPVSILQLTVTTTTKTTGGGGGNNKHWRRSHNNDDNDDDNDDDDDNYNDDEDEDEGYNNDDNEDDEGGNDNNYNDDEDEGRDDDYDNDKDDDEDNNHQCLIININFLFRTITQTWLCWKKVMNSSPSWP